MIIAGTDKQMSWPNPDQHDSELSLVRTYFPLFTVGKPEVDLEWKSSNTIFGVF